MDDENSLDILIVGGGLIGACLMVALAGLPVKILLIEQKKMSIRSDATDDCRNLTLSPASAQILKTLGLWSLIAAHLTPIKKIHVSQQQSFGHTYINSDDDLPLGYVVPIHLLLAAIYQRIPSSQILHGASLRSYDLQSKTASIETDAMLVSKKVNLLIAADGSDSSVRKLLGLVAKVHEYGQDALVTKIHLARSHQNFAYERFTPHGPMALVPNGPLSMGLVWADTPSAVAARLDLSDENFLKKLQLAFGYRLGRMVGVGPRQVYSLKRQYMPQPVLEPVIFIGNAAHSLHPVAGQGFNLGLRDLATLAQLIAEKGWSGELFTAYVQARKKDEHAILSLTDGLVKLFSNSIPGLSFARGLSLFLFDKLPPLKNTLRRYLSGYGGISCGLACGRPILYPQSQDERCDDES